MMLRNGELISSDIITDRSLLYGDGVFTTIAISNGKPCLFQQHLNRLANDCQRLNIDNFSIENIQSQFFSAIINIETGIARITISRSSGERGYLCNKAEPVIWISVNDWPTHIEQYKQSGINCRICQQPIHPNPSLAGIKHCNRLEQVLARNEWHDDQYQEGLMLDPDGNVIEGTMSNLFLIKDQQLFTPNLAFVGVNGIIRKAIIDIAKRLQIPLLVSSISVQDLLTADALFITNSVISIWRINLLNNQQYDNHPIIKLLENELDKLDLHETKHL
ncbi:MAG: aminodeoxychorismate lyase [Gammaproteobacteria bacterium]|nr:aminodeoxychorismate lyase [Gammaproteobacteria bacterium]